MYSKLVIYINMLVFTFKIDNIDCLSVIDIQTLFGISKTVYLSVKSGKHGGVGPFPVEVAGLGRLGLPVGLALQKYVVYL